MHKNLQIKHVVSDWKVILGWAGLFAWLGMVVGCGEDPQQLFETAKFEEQQHNRTHAKELYERILRDHAKSPIAEQAKQRLEDLKKENP